MERIEVIKWEKISLVVPEREDVKIWYKGINNPENQRFIGYFWKIFYLEDEYEFYDNVRKNKEDRTFSVYLRETSEIIGNISLFNISTRHRNATLGMCICDEKYQNQGLGTEALKLMLEFGFKNLGLYKIKLEVQAENHRAIRVYEKCGFVAAGVLRCEIFDGEKFSDMICMEIFREDFFSQKQ